MWYPAQRRDVQAPRECIPRGQHSLVNELAILCDRMGIDVWEVVQQRPAPSPSVSCRSAGPGLGGNCTW